MSKYYKPQRIRNLFEPNSDKKYKLSRSKIDLFLNCPRCFYLDRRLGVGQPPGYPFSLNSAVDALLKKEFDYYRDLQKPHPLITQNNINAVPYSHAELEVWRDSLRAGIQYPVPDTNLIISGGVDDVWLNLDTQELIIVDYKATSKNEAVSLDADWQVAYKRQAEIYQWLFRKNNFKVANTAYFVYCNGRTDLDTFDNKLEFEVSLLPYEGNDDWVDNVIKEAYDCLCSNKISSSGDDCDYCQYNSAVLSKIM